ncbi:hypothetical protein [Nonomuraea salmonea]|uniref:hypothetical protein n=1 Tax=Nonomuraea salmonea TaxID=46181 RepID=UPI0031EB913B
MSSSTSIDRLAAYARNSRARCSSEAGMAWAGQPSQRRKSSRTAAGAVVSRRSAYRMPSEKSARRSQAACTASADLPAPACPCTTTCSPITRSSSPARPVKPLTSGGSSTGGPADTCRETSSCSMRW